MLGICGLTVVPLVKIFRPVYHGLATSKYGGLQATANAFRALRLLLQPQTRVAHIMGYYLHGHEYSETGSTVHSNNGTETSTRRSTNSKETQFYAQESLYNDIGTGYKI